MSALFYPPLSSFPLFRTGPLMNLKSLFSCLSNFRYQQTIWPIFDKKFWTLCILHYCRIEVVHNHSWFSSSKNLYHGSIKNLWFTYREWRYNKIKHKIIQYIERWQLNPALWLTPWDTPPIMQFSRILLFRTHTYWNKQLFLSCFNFQAHNWFA